jgi:hypothetical protein
VRALRVFPWGLFLLENTLANALYDSGRESFLSADIDWLADNIKVCLVEGYTADAATHDFLDDITGGGGGTIVATSGNLANKTATDGVADADDVTLEEVPSGDPCEHLVIYKDTGSAATSNLIAVIDTATGLPLTPNGGDVTIAWDSGANKIFKL